MKLSSQYYEERNRTEARVIELRRDNPHATCAEVVKVLRGEGHINPVTLLPYTSFGIKHLWLDENEHEDFEQAEQYARQLKGSGKTYAEVIEIMRAEGWVNPRTRKRYGLCTLRRFCLGLGDQRGKRNSKQRGETAEERAEYWRQVRAEWRAENREYLRQIKAEAYANQTEAEREAERVRQREGGRRRRAEETAEQREQRLVKRREYERRRRALRNDK